MLLLDGKDSEDSTKNEEDVARDNSNDKSDDVWDNVAIIKGFFRPAKEDDGDDINDCEIYSNSKRHSASGLPAHCSICRAIALDDSEHR